VDGQVAAQKTDLECETCEAKAAIGSEANQLAEQIAATMLKG